MQRLEDENNNYRLWVSDYYGNATDSFSVHNGYHFSTVDRNNDEAPKCCPCAPSYGGGWWFYRYIDVFIVIEFHENKIIYLNKSLYMSQHSQYYFQFAVASSLIWMVNITRIQKITGIIMVSYGSCGGEIIHWSLPEWWYVARRCMTW